MDESLAECVEEYRDRLVELAHSLWDHPELGLHEERSSKLLQEELSAAGFDVTADVGGMPTAFTASYGSGEPRIGILAEFDALPGLSQHVTAERDPIEAGAPGHGCGHNLFGVGSLGGALAVRDAIEAGELTGTVVYYGCPAEETLVGKVYMARAGVFDDLDAALSWHPSRYNSPFMARTLAMDSVQFEFEGEAAHAAVSPDSGRSALDAVQLMNTGAEYLREHVPDSVRIHYSIVDGGSAPNVVPASASVWYFVRAHERETVEHVSDRLSDIASGAAQMTQTTFERTVLTACHSVLPNETIGGVIEDVMQDLGSFEYDDEQREFAADLKETLSEDTIASQYSYLPPDVLEEVTAHDLYTEPLPPYDAGEVHNGSTDVGEVSRIAPLAQFWAATWPVGTPAHSWQAVAANGSFGVEGMVYASKLLSDTCGRLMSEPETLKAAKEEFEEETDGTTYESPLPAEAEPPFHLTVD